MDILFECAKNYEKLSNIRYKIIAGRKKDETISFNVGFNVKEFHHLFGLHKLTDTNLPREKRGSVFENIINRTLTWEDIAVSSFIKNLDSRVDPLLNLEYLFDNNEMIFTYDENKYKNSKIEGDFLLQTPLNQKMTYIFLSEGTSGNCFCRSLFYEKSDRYIKGQTKYKLLYKEKFYISSGESEIQYNKLKKTENKED